MNTPIISLQHLPLLLRNAPSLGPFKSWEKENCIRGPAHPPQAIGPELGACILLIQSETWPFPFLPFLPEGGSNPGEVCPSADRKWGWAGQH